MSSARRKRKSLDVSALKPPAIKPCALTMSAGTCRPGGTSVGAKGMGGAGWVGDKLVLAEIDPPAVRITDIEPGRAAEIADYGAVLRRDLAQILGADQAAGTVHVLDDEAGLAVDMLDKIFGEQAAFDVG